uniref:F-box domain-containing protein n=1 Tax=Strongyloides papillosus TaxID=174720 RepID=A0A0N5C2A9_STREA
MDGGDKNNIAYELSKENSVRKLINHISSFTDISNLMNVCKSMNCDLEKQEIEKRMFFYSDKQKVSITCDDEYDEASGVPGFSNLRFREDSHSEDRLNILKTSFGETLPCGNRVMYSIDVSKKEWKEGGRLSFIKKLN